MKILKLFGLIIFIISLVIRAESSSLNDSLLLYASFDKYANRADYANGWDRFGGGGYKLIKGYKESAVDLRNHGLEKDFWRIENSYLPHMMQFLFWPRGNVNYRQGTLEFFLSGLTNSESEILGFLAHQPLTPEITNGKITKNYQPFVRMSNGKLRWYLVSLKGEHIEGNIDLTKIVGFKRITPNQWVHFAMQWSPEGISLYLDGRLLKTQALNDDGLALVSQPNRAVNITGVILDEFKIYDAPRYGKSFEPDWNGSRPATAFPGVAEEQALSKKKYLRNKPLSGALISTTAKVFKLKNWEISLDEKTGVLTKISNGNINEDIGSASTGLQIWQGTERKPLLTPKIIGVIKDNVGTLFFEQLWQGDISIVNKISEGKNGEVFWDLEFLNKGNQKQELEALLGLPIAFKPKDFFDMSWEQTKLDIPRRRDEYVYSIPFVAVSNGNEGIGVGLDPSCLVSALVGEWMPARNGQAALIRQGTQVVLEKNEKQKLRFILVKSSGTFGVKDALAAYQDAFPKLYKQRPDVSKYSYMGTSQHFRFTYTPEISRQIYSGNQWGHLPYHTKGDYLGRERFWGREDLKDDPSYKHAANSERINKTIENQRKNYFNRNKDSYDNYYTLMRTHDNPNSTAAFIVREVLPGVDFKDDPLTAGQYYLPGFIYVNEANNPFGEMLKEDMVGMLKLAGKYSTGITNDLSQWTSYRFNDKFVKGQPGRAFSVDRGEYLVASVGVSNRYKLMDSITFKGKARTMWSDYGGISYSTSAYSSANAIESGEWFYSLGGLQIGLEVGRNMLGEKPMTLLSSYGLDDIGSRFKITDFTPATLRDYYRFGFRRLMLSALTAGYYLDPMTIHGKLYNFETNPILVESLINGRKTVAAIKARDPLWGIRGGDDGKDILIIGNSSVDKVTSDVEVFNQYFKTDGQFIWAPYFGGELNQKITQEISSLKDVKVEAHDVFAVKPIAALIGTESSSLKSSWSGDGLTIKVEINANLTQNGKLKLVVPVGYYSVKSVKVNGKDVAIGQDFIVSVAKGKNQIEATLQNTVLNFSSEQWSEVKLIDGGKTNFVLLSGNTSYEKGTANQLNLFLNQYDEEDGIEGNLVDAPFYNSPENIPASFGGWKLDFRVAKTKVATGVTIDKGSKTIKVNGSTAGEVRRATMLFMRLVDNKYAHIGRFIPLGINLERGSGKVTDPENAWKKIYNRRSKALAFFETFEDKDFLNKPILNKESESLYVNGNKNFEGKYVVKRSPYLFEPTYFDNMAYEYFD
ncbi:hypothetical protein [Pseudopedobacter beijingensis]|uniref:Concanavalin A-like lectin/glucanases superfamily protein n=1 Tax=Pseudopedobacter beijingensis TaxID=1207056 RepID=A0ABW4IGJ1_9SPHI